MNLFILIFLIVRLKLVPLMFLSKLLLFLVIDWKNIKLSVSFTLQCRIVDQRRLPRLALPAFKLNLRKTKFKSNILNRNVLVSSWYNKLVYYCCSMVGKLSCFIDPERSVCCGAQSCWTLHIAVHTDYVLDSFIQKNAEPNKYCA